MQTNNTKKVTLSDLAKVTGLSIKTVSIALRHGPGVSAQSRNRVLNMAKEVGFGNGVKTTKSSRKKLTIGVCIPDLAEHYGELTQEIIRYAAIRNFAVIPQITNDNDADELRATQIFKRLGVAAVVLTSSRIGEAAIQDLSEDGILVVAMVSVSDLQESIPHSGTATIFLDHYTSTNEATKYLINLGHKRIAYLAGPRNSYSNNAKCEGYKKALCDADIPVDDKYIIVQDKGRFDCATGYEECLDLLARPQEDKPTALICYNDELALGALACLSEQHVDVPKQISIVGCDDIKHARYWRPSLTTIGVPRTQLAQEAIDMIHEYNMNPGTIIDRNFKIMPKLNIRGSTGPCMQPR
jgi:DNA-binding LacI/PurR family transcriptional regulator